ncbi:hypothetical protein BMS3Abin07_00871 [bacterium BMS3Abin07]|nr:hypothetical protein BMS3Abin07_00871 [bacterium BMS3Abin07]GBE31659.1 hypothetical protein BMS3Bbin05_00562 [bacterium BMS3Bbin05]HDO22712.1 hypothetical protein [Nitrospirota bacterium]HDZ88524.1 hypothetical protein [Nitrospirota bacterium]
MNSFAGISRTGLRYSLFQALPVAIQAEDGEAMQFVEDYRLMGKGLGYIDVHLLASALMTEVPIWTLDKKLEEVSIKLRMVFHNK